MTREPSYSSFFSAWCTDFKNVMSQTHFSDDISANWKRMCFFFIFFVNFLNNEPDIHLQVWPTLVKTVGIIAIKWRVNVIGVGMLDGVVGKNGLEMDVMVPLVGQIDMNVYWIQVKIFFLINNVIKLVYPSHSSSEGLQLL